MPKFLNEPQWYGNISNPEAMKNDVELFSPYPIIPTTISKVNNLPLNKNAIYYNPNGFDLFENVKYPFTISKNPNYIEVSFGTQETTPYVQKTSVGIGWGGALFNKNVILKRVLKTFSSIGNAIWEIESPENELLLFDGNTATATVKSLTPDIPASKGVFRVEIKHNACYLNLPYQNLGTVCRYFDFSFENFYMKNDVRVPNYYEFKTISASEDTLSSIVENWGVTVYTSNANTGEFVFQVLRTSGNGTATANITKIWFIANK